MDRMEAEDFSLFGLLARTWTLDASVTSLTFDNSGSAAAFALADGSVAIARIKDPEAAAKRIRISAEDGRSSILPRSKPLPPITRFTVQETAPAAVTAYGKHGFALGDRSGQLISTTVGGERTPFSAQQNNAIIALDHHEETGLLACATDTHQVILIGRDKAKPVMLDQSSPVHTLSISPDGSELAVALQSSVAIWSLGDAPAKNAELPAASAPLTLAWKPDQAHLAAGYEKNGVGIWQLSDGSHRAFMDYPSPVGSIAWSADGDMLITSGAFRVIAWPMEPTNKPNGGSPSASALETGKPSLVAVEAVASHPKRPLIAAGYENGMLIIAHIGSKDELVIKTEGDGAVTALAWSKDGGYLALGSDRGLAAIVELPTQLFK